MTEYERSPYTAYNENEVENQFEEKFYQIYKKRGYTNEHARLKAKKRARRDKIITLNEMDNIQWLIPKENWCDIKEFFGMRAKALFHYQFNELWYKAMQLYKPKSENLVLFSCSGSKPYSKSTPYDRYIKIAKQYNCFDLAVVSASNPVLLYPLDTSIQYPNIFYDFPHTESAELENLNVQNNVQCLSYMINKFKYKKVILSSVSKRYWYKIIDELILLHPDVEIIQPNRSILFDLLIEMFKRPGLASNRFNASYAAALAIFSFIDRLDLLHRFNTSEPQTYINFFKRYGIENIFNASAGDIANLVNHIKFPSKFCLKSIKKESELGNKNE